MHDFDLRRVMRNFATGVCIATTYTDSPAGRVHDALTVNSLTSVSLAPPLVSICLRPGSAFLADLLVTGVWATSILDSGSDDLAALFAADRADRIAAIPTLSAVPGARTGALVLDAAGWLECALRDHRRVGDHTMVTGEVLAASAGDRRPPLIFLHGRFHALEESRS